MDVAGKQASAALTLDARLDRWRLPPRWPGTEKHAYVNVSKFFQLSTQVGTVMTCSNVSASFSAAGIRDAFGTRLSTRRRWWPSRSMMSSGEGAGADAEEPFPPRFVEMWLTPRHFFQTERGFVYGPIHWQLTRPGHPGPWEWSRPATVKRMTRRQWIHCPLRRTTVWELAELCPPFTVFTDRWSCVVIDRRCTDRRWEERRGCTVGFFIASTLNGGPQCRLRPMVFDFVSDVCHRCCGMNWYRRHRQWNRNFGRVDQPNLRARPLVLILVMWTAPLKCSTWRWQNIYFPCKCSVYLWTE